VSTNASRTLDSGDKFIHSSHKYLLIVYYPPGPVLGPGNTRVNKTACPCHLDIYTPEGNVQENKPHDNVPSFSNEYYAKDVYFQPVGLHHGEHGRIHNGEARALDMVEQTPSLVKQASVRWHCELGAVLD
jgi:hypothetical protein